MNHPRHLQSIPNRLLQKLNKNNTKFLFTLVFLLLSTVLTVGVFCLKKYNPQKNTALAPVEIPAAEEPIVPPPGLPISHYIEIVGGCTWEFTGACVNMRSGPGLQYPVHLRLRTGMVFRVEAIPTQADGYAWYKIIFDKRLSYPERVDGDMFIALTPEAVRLFEDVGDVDLKPNEKIFSKKHIIVDISDQTLHAYDSDSLFMEESISTGVDLDQTEVGEFSIFRKTPSRYMQGPLPGAPPEQEYDLPGVPWDLYFSADGSVIHGVYWHNNFGEPMSHGCINQSPENAKKLYEWADIGTKVTIQD